MYVLEIKHKIHKQVNIFYGAGQKMKLLPTGKCLCIKSQESYSCNSKNSFTAGPAQYGWQCRKGGKCPEHMLSQGALGEG